MEYTVEHEIWLRTPRREIIIATQLFTRSFNRAAFQWFDRHGRGMNKVADTTLAGYHYESPTTIGVLELR